jgi:hypothetical protein
MGDVKYEVLVGNPKWKELLWTLSRSENIKMDIKEIGQASVM